MQTLSKQQRPMLVPRKEKDTRCKVGRLVCPTDSGRSNSCLRQKSDIYRLDHRLEALEEQLRAAAARNVSQESPTRAHTPAETTRVGTPQVDLENAPKDDGGFSTSILSMQALTRIPLAFLYRMVSGAKHSIETLTTQSSEPSSPWTQSTVNSAITRLDTALVQLAAPFPRPDSRPPNDSKINLPKGDLKQHIESMNLNGSCILRADRGCSFPRLHFAARDYF